VTVAPNEKTRYDAVDDECETGDCSAVSMQVLCEKSLATVNLLTIGEGRRKLETSTITLCTTRVKKGMIKVKVNYLLGLVVGLRISPRSVLPSGYK
jgi:hypothetical protein